MKSYSRRLFPRLSVIVCAFAGAVPWYQSIEIDLSLRRFGKDCIFLPDRGEPYHPRKYPHKLDDSIKMMETFNHDLKGAPAAAWTVAGVPYNGK